MIMLKLSTLEIPIHIKIYYLFSLFNGDNNANGEYKYFIL